MFELEVELSASLEGKKKPKVHNIQEAAARTVAAAGAAEGELDISGWLEDDEQEQKPAPPPGKRYRRTIRLWARPPTIRQPCRPARANREKNRKSKNSHRRAKGGQHIVAGGEADGGQQPYGGRGRAETFLPQEEGVNFIERQP